MNYKDIIFNLENGVNFSYSRFGDGELFCINGKSGHNCDHCEYYPDLGAALRKVIDNPRGVMALMEKGRDLRRYDIDWVDGCELMNALKNKQLDKFYLSLRSRDVILVGPERLRKLDLWDEFVDVPDKNAWLKYDKIKQLIADRVFPNDVIIYAVGMVSPVLINDLYSDQITQIDIGAVFDPYVGVESREYHRKL